MSEHKYISMTVRELAQNYTTIPWMEFLNELLKPHATVGENEQVILPYPSFISQLERILNETSKRVQANYVMWRVILSSVEYLSDEIRAVKLAFKRLTDGDSIDFSILRIYWFCIVRDYMEYVLFVIFILKVGTLVI